MRFIKLEYNNFELFQSTFDNVSFGYYLTHRDCFKQMWKEQGKEFWIRFLLTFRSHSAHYGFIALMSTHTEVNFSDTFDWCFIRLHELFIDGTVSDARQMIEDIGFVAERRHLLRNITSKSFARNPFFSTETRDVFRRLFTCSVDSNTDAWVFILFQMYEMFAAAVCSCLRHWISAPEMDPCDTSYWVPAPSVPSHPQPAATANVSRLSPRKKKIKTPYSSSEALSKTTHTQESFSQESMEYGNIQWMLEREQTQGKVSGPAFLDDWPSNRDPRFVDPPNPLYDPSASRDTDWRDGLDIDKFRQFVMYVKKQTASVKAGENVTVQKQTTSTGCQTDEPFQCENGKPAGDGAKGIQNASKGLVKNGSKKDASKQRAAVQTGNCSKQKCDATKVESGNGMKGEGNCGKLQNGIATAKLGDGTKMQGDDCRLRMEKQDGTKEAATCNKCTSTGGKAASHHLQENLDDAMEKIQQMNLIGVASDTETGVMAEASSSTSSLCASQKQLKDICDKMTKSGLLPLPLANDIISKERVIAKSEIGNKRTKNCQKSAAVVVSVANGSSKDLSKVQVAKKSTGNCVPALKLNDSSQKVNSDGSGDRPFRICSGCLKPESVSREFKKCKKCKEVGMKNAKYYCSRECQVSDWSTRHRQEHQEWIVVAPPAGLQQLVTVTPGE